jgi:hypothetical protein
MRASPGSRRCGHPVTRRNAEWCEARLRAWTESWSLVAAGGRAAWTLKTLARSSSRESAAVIRSNDIAQANP